MSCSICAMLAVWGLVSHVLMWGTSGTSRGRWSRAARMMFADLRTWLLNQQPFDFVILTSVYY